MVMIYRFWKYRSYIACMNSLVRRKNTFAHQSVHSQYARVTEKGVGSQSQIRWVQYPTSGSKYSKKLYKGIKRKCEHNNSWISIMTKPIIDELLWNDSPASCNPRPPYVSRQVKIETSDLVFVIKPVVAKTHLLKFLNFFGWNKWQLTYWSSLK